MSQPRRLKVAVLVPDEYGVFRHFDVGDQAPAWAAKQLGGADVWQEAPEKQDEPVDNDSDQSGADVAESASEEQEETSEEETPTAPSMPQPSVNGSLVDWQAYAKHKGATDEDIDGKSRNELRAQYSDNQGS